MVKNTKEYHLVLTVGSARWRIVDRSGGAGPEKDSSVAWHFVDNKTKRETVFFWYRGDPYVLSGTVLRHTLAMQFIPFVILGRQTFTFDEAKRVRQLRSGFKTLDYKTDGPVETCYEGGRVLCTLAAICDKSIS